ncbi:MAG TPA: ATP synthase F1 subunit gamma [Sorangium sp.]|nr:ATP synthase F1 subunit gamma [Sorangium sp.]
MASLKSIRKRISSVKSTQKITRAMKMVAGARLTRAQRRISELRPYALKTQRVLSEVTAASRRAEAATEDEQDNNIRHRDADDALKHPLLQLRPERHVLFVVMTSDRGLCGSFNASICKRAEQQWHEREANGQKVLLLVVGRKGYEYFTRRNAPLQYVPDMWADLDWDSARELGRKVLQQFLRQDDPVDAIYLVYNEFKSAMTQKVVAERLLPVADTHDKTDTDDAVQFIFEPNERALLTQLAPMYVQVSILRALYESMASELGARMTAMDSATNNANDMIAKLTLQYNRARQAAITTELMEIIGGSEALKG